MKLAEALVLRADCQKRMSQLKHRLERCVKVQEGEEAPENPEKLLRELNAVIGELTGLVKKINRTNSATSFDQSKTLSEVLAERDALAMERDTLEALIDHGADRLEELRARTLRVSQRIFRKPQPGRRGARRTSRSLNAMLMEIGDMGAHLSHVHETLLVLQRAVPFVAEHGDGWLAPALKTRLKVAGVDVQSLNEYEIHLTDKLQFLLDAALGFINTEQNDLFKVMTIWSVAGIPPVLVAGVYGMNFHYMPELGWTLGYPYGLALIVVSGALPLAWFKWRGWW